MQTKHLHLLLLILLAAGCGPRPHHVRQTYISDNKDINIHIPTSFRATLLAFGKRAVAEPGTAPSLFLEFGDSASTTHWQAQWCSASGDPIEMPRREVTRSLLALHLTDTAAAVTQTAVSLPGGDGFALYLDGWSAESVSLVLRGEQRSLPASEPRRADKRTFVIRIDGSSALAIASRHFQSDVRHVDQGWAIALRPARARTVFLAFGSTEAVAIRSVKKWLGTDAEELETATRRSLDERLALRLQTEDDRTNRAFVLLSTVLVDAARLQRYDSYPAIEQSAQMTAALWLASHQRPAMVFEPDTSAVAHDIQFRWGSTAWRAALAYGMVGEDTLQQISRDALALLARLQSDYAASGVTVVADKSVTDSLMREAIGCVRLASLFNLGEEIALAAQDNEAQGDFRRWSLNAARGAKERFNESVRRARLNELARLQAGDTLASGLRDALRDWSLSDVPHTRPDTVLYLSAGAHLGFGWLSNQPESLYNPLLPLDGFARLKWLAWRFAHDPVLTETGDLDSLCTLLLEGPVPGFLTDDSDAARLPSVEVMAAALQNLSEVYLGVQPNALQSSVSIEPHLPASWGRSRAQVPFGSGSLWLDYNLAESYAIVGMDDYSAPLDVLFGYPLPGGGFLRAQFTLEPGKHPMRIALERDRDNRYQLNVSEVP